MSPATPRVPTVSVIVPCRDEERYIARCLDSIAATDYPRERLEVLAVDGVSEDRTRAIVADYGARYPFIRLLDNPGRIPPTAVNAGIRAARGEILVRMDAHVVYPPEYIPRSIAALAETGADNVGGVVVTRPAIPTAVGRAIAIALSHPFGVGNSRYRIGSRERRWVDTVAFGCFRADVFQRIGLFDEDLPRNQDDELNFRLTKQGGRVLLEPSVVAYSFALESLGQLARMWYQYGYFKPLVAKKVGRVMNLRQLVPACFILCLTASAALTPFLESAQLVLAGITGSYAALSIGYGLAAARKHGLACALVLPIAFLAIHVAHGVGFLRGVAHHVLRLGKSSPDREPTVALSL